MPSFEEVVDDRDDDHASVHEWGPIHVLRRHRRHQRPKVEEPDGREEDERRDVDREAVSSQGPSARRQGLSPKTLQCHAADCDVVGGYDGHAAERVDGVECGTGTDVDACEQGTHAERDQDRTEGNIPSRCNLRQGRQPTSLHGNDRYIHVKEKRKTADRYPAQTTRSV